MVLFSALIGAQVRFLLQSLDESNSDSVVFRELCQLSLYEKVGVGLSLADFENVAIRTNGQSFCIGQIDQLLRSSAVLESAEQIQNVIMFLDRSEGLSKHVDSKHVDSFMLMLYLMEPKGRTPLIFSPLLSHEIVNARNMDLFYGCSENEFDAILAEMAPDTNWIHIMENLDHEGFYLPSGQAFSLFMSVCHRASQEPFPLHALCRFVWKNVEGQLSFLTYAVSAPPEIFTFAHSSRKLACANALSDKVVPQGLKNHAWISLDLLEVLCGLAERGHAKSVCQILESPLKQCPELLLLGNA